MHKMVQSNRWILQLILLCQLWQLGFAGVRGPEYSSVGVHQKKSIISEKDIGDILLFIVIVIIGEIGKKLDKGYICPVYCGVNHIHRIPNYDTKAKQVNDEEADPPQDGSIDATDRQQSESSIRPVQDID